MGKVKRQVSPKVKFQVVLEALTVHHSFCSIIRKLLLRLRIDPSSVYNEMSLSLIDMPSRSQHFPQGVGI